MNQLINVADKVFFAVRHFIAFTKRVDLSVKIGEKFIKQKIVFVSVLGNVGNKRDCVFKDLL